MSVKITGKRIGPLSTKMIHEPSANEIQTTPPKDNGGDGTSFSPTDLCAASLGACATTIISLYAQSHNIPIEGIDFEVIKEMQSNPRRIASLAVRYKIKSACSLEDFQKLITAGETCPVRQSLHPDLKIIEEYQQIKPNSN